MLIFSLSVQYSLKLVALNLQSVIILCSGRRDSIKSVMSSVRFYQHIIKLVSASRQMPSILTNLESLAWRIWFPESLLGTSLYKCHNVSCTDINLKYTKLCCVFSFFTHCGTLLNTTEHYWTLLNTIEQGGATAEQMHTAHFIWQNRVGQSNLWKQHMLGTSKNKFPIFQVCLKTTAHMNEETRFACCNNSVHTDH